jgi:hypothetical protein
VGAGLLAGVARLTVWVGLLALAGTLAAWWLARRRGRVLTRGRSWLGSVLGGAIVVAIYFGVAFASLPPGAFARMERQRRENQSKVQKMPAWFERTFPDAAKRSAAPSTTPPGAEQWMQSTAVRVWMMLAGGALVCLTLGGLAGTAGWASAILVGYALTGRWPPSRRAVRLAQALDSVA